MSGKRLLERARAGARALRGFLAGFTGMPSPRLRGPCRRCEGGTARAAREALGERATRRPSCC